MGACGASLFCWRSPFWTEKRVVIWAAAVFCCLPQPLLCTPAQRLGACRCAAGHCPDPRIYVQPASVSLTHNCITPSLRVCSYGWCRSHVVSANYAFVLGQQAGTCAGHKGKPACQLSHCRAKGSCVCCRSDWLRHPACCCNGTADSEAVCLSNGPAWPESWHCCATVAAWLVGRFCMSWQVPQLAFCVATLWN